MSPVVVLLLDLYLLSLPANIYKSVFYVQCKSFIFAPLGLFAYMKTCHLPFISLFWLQRSLLFVGNIHAIYLFLSLLHCTGAGVVSMAMLLSLAAPEGFTTTTYGAASDQGAVEVTILSFQWVSKGNSDSVTMCAGRVTLRSAQSHRAFSLFITPF